MRYILVGLALVVATGLAALILAAAKGSGRPVFTPDMCAVRQIVDEETAKSVEGAEDIALSDDGRWLIVSAYDRLAAGRALATNAELPNGGLYRVAISELLRDDASALSLVNAEKIGGLRPHGIALDEHRLAVINRRSGPSGLLPVIEVYDLGTPEPKRTATFSGAHLCAANNLAWQNDALLVTRERAHCPGWSFAERIFGARRASVIRLPVSANETDYEIMADGLFFANGIAVRPDGSILVAETRGKALQLLSEEHTWQQIAAPGGPDNLTLFGDAVIGAWQQNLLRFGLYRFGHTERVGSRLSKWDPASGWTLLYEDPSGKQFSGATVGVQPADDVLIAGSVRAPGLLVCQTGAAT